MASQDLYPGFDPPDVRHEADIFGTWFARLGAIALLLGAGFGFKYAVDEGIIGPAARVVLGIALGLVMIGGAEATWRKGWSKLTQAVGGGGIAVLYLSIWAAYGRYELVGAPEAFTGLALVAFAGGYIALRYESMALAVLATLGGFANPLLAGGGLEHPIAILAYIVVIDLAVVALGYFRGWRTLDHLALWGTWILFAFYVGGSELGALWGGPNPPNDGPFAFATLFFLMFGSLPVIRRTAGSRTSNDASDLFLMILNAIAYAGASFFLLSDDGDIAGIANELWQGPVLLMTSAVYASAGLVLRMRRPQETFISSASFGFAIAALAAWAPVQLAPAFVPLAWATQGALCIALAGMRGFEGSRIPGLALLGMSITYLGASSSQGGFYDPATPVVSPESFAVLGQIAAVGFSSYSLSRASEEWARGFAQVLAIMAGLLGMLWISLEVFAHHRGEWPGWDGVHQAREFTLTAAWGLYATALLIGGIVFRSFGARIFGIGVFGITLFKLLFQDVWTLDSLQRTFVFLGLGVALLACSVMYHRLKDLVTPDRGLSPRAE